MKAITVKQPWAWAIVHGGKDVENRSQVFRHRGLLAIHAGKGWDAEGAADSRILNALAAKPTLYPYANGEVIGVAMLAAVHSAACPGDCSPWAEPGATHLRLRYVRPIPHPVAVRGALGLWTLPEDVATAVGDQIPVCPTCASYGRPLVIAHGFTCRNQWHDLPGKDGPAFPGGDA